MIPCVPASLFDAFVASRLWSAAKAMVHAWLHPDLGFRVPPDAVVGTLVFGVFLVVAGTAFAAKGKGKLALVLALAAGTALAGWILWGGMREVSAFFVVILLLLKFLGGVTLVLGLFRSLWGPAAVLAAVILAATGAAPAETLAFALSVLASFLGALSLFRKAEELSPGRKGSRWNRRTAVGWVACLLAVSVLEERGLAVWGGEFRIAGVIVGVALLVLHPGFLGGGVLVKVARKG